MFMRKWTACNENKTKMKSYQKMAVGRDRKGWGTSGCMVVVVSFMICYVLGGERSAGAQR